MTSEQVPVLVDYTSEKVRSVCFTSIKTMESPIPLFLSASWNEKPNQITLWQSDTTLHQVSSIEHDGDICDMKWINFGQKSGFLSASSTGTVSYFTLGPSETIEPRVSAWNKLFTSSITSMDINQDDRSILVSSENGKLALLALESPDPHQLIGTRAIDPRLDNHRLVEADSTAIYAARFLGSSRHFVTAGANPQAQLKLWDLNADSTRPVQEMTSCDRTTAYHSVELHPTRPELFFTGDNHGTVTLWDRRNACDPVFQQTDHSDSILTCLKLHPFQPQYLYTTGTDGTILEWDFKQKGDYSQGAHTELVCKTRLAWNQMDLDPHSSTLLAGSDNGAIMVCPLTF